MARAERNLSQAALATSTGLHPATIGRIERGQTDPSFTALAKIVEALGLSLGEFFTAADREAGLATR